MTTWMKFSQRQSAFQTSNQKYDAWLVVDGITVSFLSVMVSKVIDADKACICEIETRDGYKQQGHAAELMKRVSKELKMPLATTGGYTPEGFAAFNGKIPLWNGYQGSDKPSYRQMGFVSDWDSRQAMH